MKKLLAILLLASTLPALAALEVAGIKFEDKAKVGAGDTVISVAALCLATDTDPIFLASLSNLAGGLVCEQSGVVPVDKFRLMAEAYTEE